MPDETPLESWKEIAAYLQRNAVPVRRWEREEGLPVHRHSHKSRSSVYAYPSEIDAWRASRRVVAEAAPAPAPVSTRWRVPAFALATLVCLMMAGSGIRPQAASAKDGPLAKRLVCSDCGDSEGNLSQDGRWLVYTDWYNGDLAIRDMKTGKVKRLMAKPGEWGSGAYGEAPVLSPDNRQIVYDWFPGKGDVARDQLRVMPNEPGGKARVLVNSPGYTYFQTEAWFPDGKSVLASVTKADGTDVIARVSLSDGAVKELKPLERRFWRAGRISLSPDARHIAYAALAVNPSSNPPAPSDPKDFHIYILTADGSSATEIVKTAGVNREPFWTADGKHILFTSDRTGKTSLWSIRVQDGKAVGEASLVSSDLGDIAAFSMAGGSFIYYARSQNDFFHVAKIGPEGATETQSLAGTRPTWSPDGKSVAFKRHHPGAADEYDLVTHSLETGDERAYLTNLGTTGAGAPYWFHDGSSLMTGFGHPAAAAKFYRIDVETGELKELPVTPRKRGALSPDDKTFYHMLSGGSAPDRVVAVDLATGQERPVFTSTTNRLAIALSPDGRALALGWPSTDEKVHIARVSIDGSGFREVFTGAEGLNGGAQLRWGPDGRSILFDQKQPGGGPQWGVMQVPADGGEAKLVLAVRDRIQRFDLSPDGSRVAYSSSNNVDSELWALDNVVPALK